MRKTAVTPTELARHLGFAPQQVTKLVNDGVISRMSNGRFDQDASRLAYIKWLRDPARRQVKSEAAARLQAAKATEVELRNLERAGQLGRLEDMTAAFDSLVANLRAALDGLPARVTRDLELRRKIEDEIRAALTAASEALEREAVAEEATAQEAASADFKTSAM